MLAAVQRHGAQGVHLGAVFGTWSNRFGTQAQKICLQVVTHEADLFSDSPMIFCRIFVFEKESRKNKSKLGLQVVNCKTDLFSGCLVMFFFGRWPCAS
jgi:hypothetical protein